MADNVRRHHTGRSATDGETGPEATIDTDHDTHHDTHHETDTEPETDTDTDTDTAAGPRSRRPSPMRVLRAARAQFAELTGLNAESVSSFEPTDDGWSLQIEVLELARVPDTVSLLATYQVTLDHSGELTGYRRTHRYERGRADRG